MNLQKRQILPKQYMVAFKAKISRAPLIDDYSTRVIYMTQSGHAEEFLHIHLNHSQIHNLKNSLDRSEEALQYVVIENHKI